MDYCVIQGEKSPHRGMTNAFFPLIYDLHQQPPCDTNIDGRWSVGMWDETENIRFFHRKQSAN